MNIDGLIHINVFQFIYEQSNSDRVDWVGVISLSMESRDMCCQWPFGFELLSTCFAWYHVLDIRMSVTKRTHWTVNKMCDYLLVNSWLNYCHKPYLDAICRRFAAIDVNVRLHILHFKLSSGFELFHDAAEKEVQPKKKISFCPWIKLGYKKNQIKPKSNKIIQLNLNQIIKRK